MDTTFRRQHSIFTKHYQHWYQAADLWVLLVLGLFIGMGFLLTKH